MKKPRPSTYTAGSMTRTSGISVGTTRTSGLVLEKAQEERTVRARTHALGEPHQLRRADVTHAIRDLFEARHHQSLTLLDRVDEIRGLHQRIVRARIQPGDAARQLFDN